MSLSIQSIHPFSPYFADFKRLYQAVFPEKSRFPVALLVIMAWRPDVDFWAVLDEGEFVGFVYLINNQQATFVLYLAVDERQHSKGYGSKILALIEAEKAGKTIVLDIETVDNTAAPNHAQRLKREAFYLKNGFETMDFQLQDGDDCLDVLCKNGRIDEKGYHALVTKPVFGLVNIRTIKRKIKRQ
ncbi:GNAT family N-acetyltransferase [Neisseria sp. CCUG17229]|uniref:GNAT family N-acetyltransferase n=1 Tax=Neisseria sp. CCUG17229 TaxID=3392036 RepID=UPI003A102D9A